MSVEKTEVLSSEDHSRIKSTLSHYGKVSASELTDEERRELVEQLNHSD